MAKKTKKAKTRGIDTVNGVERDDDDTSQSIRKMKKFKSPHKPPKGFEAEALLILAEESLEVAHRVIKALRFGLQEVQPGQSMNNMERISEELGQVVYMSDFCEEAGLLNQEYIQTGYAEKGNKLRTYMQQSKKKKSGNGRRKK